MKFHIALENVTLGNLAATTAAFPPDVFSYVTREEIDRARLNGELIGEGEIVTEHPDGKGHAEAVYLYDYLGRLYLTRRAPLSTNCTCGPLEGCSNCPPDEPEKEDFSVEGDWVTFDEASDVDWDNGPQRNYKAFSIDGQDVLFVRQGPGPSFNGAVVFSQDAWVEGRCYSDKVTVPEHLAERFFDRYDATDAAAYIEALREERDE